jgi:plastocyanin
MRKILLVALFASVASVAHAADTTVTQSHTTFDMDSATIKAGDTITFSNKDDVTHNINITNPDGDNDDKGLQKPGQDIKASFPKAGEYKVHCAIHPKMKMTVTVQ